LAPLSLEALKWIYVAKDKTSQCSAKTRQAITVPLIQVYRPIDTATVDVAPTTQQVSGIHRSVYQLEVVRCIVWQFKENTHIDPSYPPRSVAGGTNAK
jgi:hypothetical protein